jgi:hypothetical protein
MPFPCYYQRQTNLCSAARAIDRSWFMNVICITTKNNSEMLKTQTHIIRVPRQKGIKSKTSSLEFRETYSFSDCELLVETLLTSEDDILS